MDLNPARGRASGRPSAGNDPPRRSPAPGLPDLFTLDSARLKSGDRVAIVGRNGCGKSSLLKLIWRHFRDEIADDRLKRHPRVSPGYYDQTLHQLPDDAALLDALEPFAPDPQTRKMALISAGFPWARHGQKVSTLSGGERSRLLFVGLTLARYSLLMLDEPTNHGHGRQRGAGGNTATV